MKINNFRGGLIDVSVKKEPLAASLESVNPEVLGRFITCCPSRPTVMFYGHYDVQLAHELVRCSAVFVIVISGSPVQ